MSHTVSDIVRLIEGLRVMAVTDERSLQDQVAAALETGGVPHRREVVLGPRSRIDFIAGDGIGIEIKKGKAASGAVEAQLDRYASHDAVKELILVVERNVFDWPRQVRGKRVRYVALSRMWGVAL